MDQGQIHVGQTRVFLRVQLATGTMTKTIVTFNGFWLELANTMLFSLLMSANEQCQQTLSKDQAKVYRNTGPLKNRKNDQCIPCTRL